MGLSPENQAVVDECAEVAGTSVIGLFAITEAELDVLLNAARAEERERLSTPNAQDNMLASIIETSIEQGRAEATEAQALALETAKNDVTESHHIALMLTAENEGLARRIGELQQMVEDAAVALHPFALEAMEWSVSTSSDVVPACGVRPTTTPAKFTVGDLRRAAQIYAALLPTDIKESSDDR